MFGSLNLFLLRSLTLLPTVPAPAKPIAVDVLFLGLTNPLTNLFDCLVLAIAPLIALNLVGLSFRAISTAFFVLLRSLAKPTAPRPADTPVPKPGTNPVIASAPARVPPTMSPVANLPIASAPAIADPTP